jgi:hypothetical protein
MQPGAVLFLDLFDGLNLSAKRRQPRKFLLDCLQPLMPETVSDLSIGLIHPMTAIQVVQFVYVSNLVAQTPNLFP